MGEAMAQVGCEINAGNANRWWNLYFFKSAYERIKKEDSKEGQE
jgi:hypothetical protein